MLASVMAAVVVALLISARPADEIMTRKGNTTIVNTTQLGAQVRGFKGATPVLIHIEKNKVVKVEALPNRETPKFFARAKAVLQQFEGLTVARPKRPMSMASAAPPSVPMRSPRTSSSDWSITRRTRSNLTVLATPIPPYFIQRGKD